MAERTSEDLRRYDWRDHLVFRRLSVDPSEGFMTAQGTPRDSSAPGENLGGKRGLEEVWEKCGSVYAHGAA